MILYSQRPGRRIGQIVADVLVVCWVVCWVVIGHTVSTMVAALAAPAYALSTAGSDVQARLDSLGSGVADVPVVGQRLAEAFASASDSGAGVSGSVTSFATGVERFGLTLGITTAAVPILVAVLPWLLTRGRFMRRARALEGLINSDADLSLFALHGLTDLPPAEVLAIDAAPTAAWRRGDEPVVRRLAGAYLREYGVRLAPEVLDSRAARHRM